MVGKKDRVICLDVSYAIKKDDWIVRTLSYLRRLVCTIFFVSAIYRCSDGGPDFRCTRVKNGVTRWLWLQWWSRYTLSSYPFSTGRVGRGRGSDARFPSVHGSLSGFLPSPRTPTSDSRSYWDWWTPGRPEGLGVTRVDILPLLTWTRNKNPDTVTFLYGF